MFSRKNIAYISFILICAFSIIFGGVNAMLLSDQTLDDQESVEAMAEDNQVLSANADVKWEYYYIKCFHTEYIETKAEKDMIGKTGKEIATLYGAQLVVFKPNKIVLRKEINYYCPNHYILKKDGDKISVYKTKSGSSDLELIKKTGFSFDSLNDNLKTEVENGKVFDTLEDIEYFLEDLDT